MDQPTPQPAAPPAAPPATPPIVESPPPAPRPPDQPPDPRRQLQDLAARLSRQPNPREMAEYLTLRRNLR